MLTVDFIGLWMTICLTGIRYPHYVLVAALVHEAGRIIMVIFLKISVDAVIAAGAFGTVSMREFAAAQSALVLFAGPLANYAVSALAGGTEFERTAHLLNPLVKLKHPLSTVNLRLAIVSLIVTTWQFYWM
ncbi:MAG: hypothetical protein N2491_04940 [Negativicutes bacterium]|nr:hypothetical protein [Negativicutes bacterium]